MTHDEFRNVLKQTLEDQRLSRSERQALHSVLKDIQPPATQLDLFRHEAFELARQELSNALDPGTVIDWLEDVVRLLKPAEEKGCDIRTEAYFSPGRACQQRIQSLFAQAKSSVDVCVFTITDNEIAEAIAGAHNRGVKIRIITDDEKSHDTGSDIIRLEDHGLDVRTDMSPHHMHHKFAIFDQSILLTGSYNWTRSASKDNEENIVVIADQYLLKKFHSLFEELWEKFAP